MSRVLVPLLLSERPAAQRLRQDYWLYVVEDASAHPRLYTIPDPAATLPVEERVEVVRYIVKDWKRGATL